MKNALCISILMCIIGLAAGQARADGGSITAAEAANHVGESTKVCGSVASAKYSTETRKQPTFLNLDRPYPNHVFTALIWGSDRGSFPYAPEGLQGKRICVKGVIELYKGKAEIIVTGPSQIEIQK
jgi:hypothetical protein